MKRYQIPDQTLWQGRRDGKPERWHQQIQCIDLNQDQPTQPGLTCLGFACDEGITRNLGRAGAALGPNALRQQLTHFARHDTTPLFDAGNILCTDQNLEESQRALGDAVKQLIDQQQTPIILGGGHSMAWGHYQGLAQTDYAKNLGIINFDAHFDLRPLSEQTHQGNSGTPFLQIANQRLANKLDFQYCCLGVNPQANTHALFATADELGCQYTLAEAFYPPDALININNQLDEFIQAVDHVYLTICLDVFAQAFAPGVSAPQGLGLAPWHVLPLLRTIVDSNKIVSIDIAELSPPHDINNQTAKLGANLIAYLVEQLGANHDG